MIGLLLAAQLVVVAHAPDTATACAPIEVSVAARVAGGVAPHIAPAGLGASVQLLNSRVVTRVERDGAGQPSSITEATFTFTSAGFGRTALPQFIATAGALRAVSNASVVDLRSSGVLPPTVLVRAWLDRGNGSAADTLFVGQQVDYVVDVQLNESARARLRRNPTFFPPEMPGVLAYDLAPPAALSRVGRSCFETLSYRRALFPLFAGRTAIAPAALTYSLPLSTSFFSREESFELRTDSVRFVALDLPVRGRPAEFAGAVGALGATSRVSAAGARMGDPVVLTLRLEGMGNVKLWPRPPLAVSWATVAEGGERVQVDTSHARVRGAKEFDWLLTPRQAGRQQVPAITYPYFSADRRAYDSTRTTPLSLDIAAAVLVAADSTPASRLAIRRTLREETPESIPSRPWYWLLLAVAPVPAVFRRARNRTRTKADRREPIRRLKQAVAREEALTARDMRRLYLDAVTERVPQASGATRRDVFVRELRRAGVTADSADAAGQLLDRLDAAAFSAAGAIEPQALREVDAAFSAIDAEAVRPRASIPLRPLVILLATTALAGALHALPDGITATFTQGVEAYDHGAYTTSQRYFARVAARAPRAVDGWANLGASAWSRGDSAAAVRAWQRALRLDPLDAEARRNLDLVQPPLVRAPGFVPPLPVNALALAALVCWVGAWAMLVVPPTKRPRNGRPIAGGALATGLVLLAGALEMRDRLDPAGLAVMRSSGVLLEAPGSQTATASATVGETGRLDAREGAWVRIALDNSRAGWVPVANVLPLDAPPSSD